MNKKKKCKHFRGEIPGHESDELRVADKEPCEVCDIVPRTIYLGDEVYHIPEFDANGEVALTNRSTRR